MSTRRAAPCTGHDKRIDGDNSMQTPAILNISSPSPAPAAGKPATGAPNASFDQMLSRQIAERRASEQSKPVAQAATAGKPQEARNPGQKRARPNRATPLARRRITAPQKASAKISSPIAGGMPPTATELLAQAAGALLAPQADRASAADAASVVRDAGAAADGAARTGRQALAGDCRRCAAALTRTGGRRPGRFQGFPA